MVIDVTCNKETIVSMRANVTNQALDEVTDLVKVFPQLCEEVKDLGAMFLPESLKLPNFGDIESPVAEIAYDNVQ